MRCDQQNVFFDQQSVVLWSNQESLGCAADNWVITCNNHIVTQLYAGYTPRLDMADMADINFRFMGFRQQCGAGIPWHPGWSSMDDSHNFLWKRAPFQEGIWMDLQIRSQIQTFKFTGFQMMTGWWLTHPSEK